MRSLIAGLAIVLVCASPARTQVKTEIDEELNWVTDAAVAARLAELPVELRLAEGSLRVVNLYRIQGEVLRQTWGQPADSVLARLVREVYAPYREFWAGYLGDEAAFRRWAPALLVATHPLHERLHALLDAGIHRRFDEGVEWIEGTLGRRPTGTWYLVFGPGWTNMGGLGEIGMVADFTNMAPDSAAVADLLPHELTHQLHFEAAENDPDHGTVLYRIVSEGLACYAAWVYGSGRMTPALAILYGESQWDWALEHEDALMQAVLPILSSRERADIDLVAHRGKRLIPNGPGAVGYFLGFRIVEAYVAAHGADSWLQLYDMPVAEVLVRSGYVRLSSSYLKER